jgi:hypothetical protein
MALSTTNASILYPLSLSPNEWQIVFFKVVADVIFKINDFLYYNINKGIVVWH